MKRVLFAILASVAFAAEAERVALVHGVDEGAPYESEFDKAFAQAIWQAEKFSNVRLPELSGKLTDYDVVIAGCIANYRRTVQLKPYASRWRSWLENGGVLLVTDANYESVLDTWVGAFGEGFECGCAACSAHTKHGPEARAVTVDSDPLLSSPRPLGKMLSTCPYGMHVTRLGPSWRRPIRCSDGQALFAYRSFGKGLVVLTAAGNLRIGPVAEALLANIAAARRRRAEGIEVTAFDPGRSEGAVRTCSLNLKVDPVRHKELAVALSAVSDDGSGIPWRAPAKGVTVRAQANGEVSCRPAVAVRQRGTVKYVLTASSKGREILRFEWDEAVPSAFTLALRRKHLYPGDALVPVGTLQPPALARGKLTGIEWKIDGGTWTTRAAKNGDWNVSVAGLATGRHEIRSRLRYADGFLDSLGDEDRRLFDWGEEQVQEFFVHAEPTYRMRSDHVLLEKGRPFFPLGFYYISWSRTDEDRLKMVEDIAAWGFNTVHTGIRKDEAKSDSYGAFLDACAKFGIRVITEFESEGDALETIRRYRGKPAVMAWNPGDEPAPKGITPQEMFNRYDRFKQLDPDHLAYTVICVPAQYANYAAGTDVLSPDPYPVPRDPVRTIYARLTDAKAAANAVDTALWSVGQAFGGQGLVNQGWKRWPNPREFRAMGYLALMAGAKGIVYYTYEDTPWFNILKAPDLLEAMKAFPAELKDVIPFVLDGKAERTAEDAAGVYATVWTLGSKRLFVAVNTSEKETEAEVPFTGGKVQQGQTLAARSEFGRMRFRLAPLERVVIVK